MGASLHNVTRIESHSERSEESGWKDIPARFLAALGMTGVARNVRAKPLQAAGAKNRASS